MGRKVFLTLSALLLFFTSARASFTGFAEEKGYFFSRSPGEKDRPAEAKTTLYAKADGSGEDFTWVASLNVTSLDPGGRKTGFDPADRGLSVPVASVRELYANFRVTPEADLTLGRFILGWGKTDGYSPADSFLPRDLTDPMEDVKLPLWGLRFYGEREGVRMDFAATPFTTPWRLPRLGSRYAPLGMKDLEVTETDGEPPGTGFAALRLLWTSGDWDLGVWGRGGTRPAPLLSFRPDPLSENPLKPRIIADRRYARESGAGFEVSRIAGPLLLRGELARLFSGDADLGNALIWALGAELNSGDTLLTATLAGNAEDTPVKPQLLFDRALLPVFILALNRAEAWGQAKISWTAGLGHGDGLLRMEVGWMMDDYWKLTLAGQTLYGDRSGPLGALYAAERIDLALKRSF